MKKKLFKTCGMFLVLLAIPLVGCSEGELDFVVIPPDEPEPEPVTYTVETFLEYFNETFGDIDNQDYTLDVTRNYYTYADSDFQELTEADEGGYTEQYVYDKDILIRKETSVQYNYDSTYIYVYNEERGHLDIYRVQTVKNSDEVVNQYETCYLNLTFADVFASIDSLLLATDYEGAKAPLSNYEWTATEERNTFVSTDYELTYFFYNEFISTVVSSIGSGVPSTTTITINDDGTILINADFYMVNSMRIWNTEIVVSGIGTTTVDKETAIPELTGYLLGYTLNGATCVPYVYNESTGYWDEYSLTDFFAPGAKVGLDISKGDGLIMLVTVNGETITKDETTGYYIFEMPAHNTAIYVLA